LLLKKLPKSIDIEDESTPDSDTEDEKPKKSPFNFGGLKVKKFDMDGVMNFSEGITFKKPKFRTTVDSVPCDLTEERDRLRKERKQQADQDLKKKTT